MGGRATGRIDPGTWVALTAWPGAAGDAGGVPALGPGTESGRAGPGGDANGCCGGWAAEAPVWGAGAGRGGAGAAFPVLGAVGRLVAWG